MVSVPFLSCFCPCSCFLWSYSWSFGLGGLALRFYIQLSLYLPNGQQQWIDLPKTLTWKCQAAWIWGSSSSRTGLRSLISSISRLTGQFDISKKVNKWAKTSLQKNKNDEKLRKATLVGTGSEKLEKNEEKEGESLVLFERSDPTTPDDSFQ